MKLGNLLTTFAFAVGASGGALAAISLARHNELATEIFTTLSLISFAFAGLLALLTFGISRAARNRPAAEVLHP